MIRKTLVSAAAAVLIGSPALADDIVEMAAAEGNFQMLIEAMEAAAFVDTLKGEGPLTFFAPNNTAFAKIEEGGEFEELKMNPSKLAEILALHVVAGRVTAADLAEGMALETLQGGQLSVTLAGGAKVNGVAIVETDIEASNGVIHVIDTILMP
jgi:uncharacterized surface protein with fasciclin (FAS1) repeats